MLGRKDYTGEELDHGRNAVAAQVGARGLRPDVLAGPRNGARHRTAPRMAT